MKKPKNAFGDVLKDVLGDILKISVIIAIIVFIVKTVNQFNSGNTSAGIMYIEILLGCIFLLWLILTIGKILDNLKEINENFSDFFDLQKDFLRAHHNQMAKKDNNSNPISHEEITNDTEKTQ